MGRAPAKSSPPRTASQLRQVKRPRIIEKWAFQHGSARLREQIAQGYEGWPLFLHECLEHDFPGARLDKGAWDYDIVLNPTDEELTLTRSFAERVVELRLVDNLEHAFSSIKLRAYDVDDEYAAMGGSEYIRREVHCIVFKAYLPGGPSNAFIRKTIRIDLPRSK